MCSRTIVFIFVSQLLVEYANGQTVLSLFGSKAVPEELNSTLAQVSADGSVQIEGLLRREKLYERLAPNIMDDSVIGLGRQEEDEDEEEGETRTPAQKEVAAFLLHSAQGEIRDNLNYTSAARLNFSSNGEEVSPGWELTEFDAHVTCTEKETALTDSGSGNLVLLETHHLMCQQGFYLAGFRMTSGGTATKAKFKYRCCKVAQEMGQCSSHSTPARSHEGGNLLALRHHEPKCIGNRLLRGFRLHKKQGNQMSVMYTCCDVAGKAKLGTCADASTKKTAVTGDARLLAKHKVACNYGMALSRWRMTVVNSQFELTSTCCPVGNQMSIGKRRKCAWVGDPHFTTFDGQRHDTTRPGAGQAYWIVKNRYVNIQAWYQGAFDWTPSVTRGVVVGGRFLRGHRLIVKKLIPTLIRNPSLLEIGEASNTSEASDTASPWLAPNVYLWDEKPIPWRNSEFIVENLVHLRLAGNRMKANLPLGVTLELVMNSYYMDNYLWMGAPPGGQVGACGDNNGQNDGNLMGKYMVPDAQNMFFNLNALEGPDEATNKRGGEQSLDQCKGDLRVLAETTCKQRITGEFLQDFLAMCIFDMCFGGKETQAQLAQGDADAEKIARLDAEFQATRTYKVVGAVGAAEAPAQCQGKMHVVKITSRLDQKAVMEAIAGQKSSEMLWVGAKHVAGQWLWYDGQPVCGYSNWDPSVNLNTPHGPWLCVSKSTGKWKTCPGTEKYNVICEDHKQYAVVKVADPVSARSACGPAHQMVMPKSASEQELLLEALKTHDAPGATMWLGGSYQNDKWVWEDGSKVCWTNWEHGQPAMAQNGEQMFMCMSTATGKWKVCTGYKNEYDVACENKNSESVCPMGQVNMLDLSLTKTPGKSFSELGGFCYYLGKGKETCHETCYNQVKGFCSRKGLVEAARTTGSCKLITAGFGGIGKDTKGQNIPSSIGCSYADLGKVSGKVVTEVMVGKGTRSPGCDDTTAYSNTHRVCACMPLPPADQVRYKQGHSLINGERVRVTGKGYDPKKAFKLMLWGTDGKSLRAEVQGTLEFYPFEMRVKTFWRDGEHGLKELADIIWWNFKTRTEEWSLDFEVTPHLYMVWVNGVRYPELDVKRKPSNMVSKIDPKGIVSPNIYLIRQEIASIDHPANMDGADDCLRYPFEVKSKVATMNFTVFLRRVDGIHCIRCEPRPVDLGNHAYIEDGKMVLVVDGAEPREQRFGFQTFKANIFYRIQLSYLAEEKIAELYVGAERVQTLHYTKSPETAFSSDSMLGCSGADDKRKINGRIDEFSISLVASPLRPPRDVCSNYACPNGYRHVPKPEKVRCAGPRCDLVDIDTCCAQLGRCSTYQCPDNYVKKLEPKNFVCLHTVCRNEECCETPGRCSQFVCPAGKVLKGSPETLSCSTKFCDSTDTDKCCDPQGKCSDFTCPEGFTHAPDAEEKFCADAECKHTDYRHCCVPRAKCSTFACPEHKIHRRSADNVACAGITCTDSEEELCCEERALCTTYTCSDRTLSIKLNASLRCSSQECQLSDESTCCEKRATCGEMTCPSHFIKKPGEFQILCKHSNCNNTDYHTCCNPQASCALLTCPAEYVHKEAFEQLVCSDTECKVSVDVDTCCDQRAPCTSMACPNNKVHVATAHKLFCKGNTCTASDAEACCVERGVCTSLACPSTLVHNSRAGTTRCEEAVCSAKDYPKCCEERARCDTNVCPARQVLRHNARDLLCVGAACTEEDWVTCCVENGHCTSLHCPPGRVHRKVPKTIWCAAERCTPADVDTCCDTKAKCTSALCLPSRVHRHNASTLECSGNVCTSAEDERHCCTHRKACSALKCPASHTHRAHAHDQLLCAAESCEESERDWNQCCEPRATCDRMECPGHMVLKSAVDPASVMCVGASCGSSDIDTCCELRGNCSSYRCPTGTQHKTGADKILCKDAQCQHTDFHTCCTDNGRCDAHPCAEGYVRREHAKSIFCSRPTCTSEDLELCCRPVAKCNTFSCPQWHVLRKEAASLKCKGKVCNGLLDTNTCCEAKGVCSRMRCPDKYVLVPGAEHITCADSTCTHTDFKKCCVERAKCTSMSCPYGYVYKEVPGSLWCAGTSCTEKLDRDTCCDERDRCSSMTCPQHYLHVPNATQVFCAGKTCTAAEFPVCCVMQARCTSLECPAGHVPKAAASGLFCRGTKCEMDADLGTCCDRLGKCDDHECPSDMALKDEHWGITCAAKDCAHNECCNSLAKCHSYNCPPGKTLKSNPSSIPCGDTQCSEHDLHSCCEDLGTCDKYLCPQGAILKPHASSIFCTDATCVNTDYELCCQESARCSSFTCPQNSIMKANSSRIFCNDGYTCSAADTDLCCDKLASCESFSMCPPNTYRTDDPAALCMTPQCTQADEPACCIPTPRCSTFQCPSKYVLKDDAASVFCDDRYCRETDYQKCCVETAKCSSMRCPASLVLRPTADEIHCKGFLCSIVEDVATCCEEKARCNSTRCPENTTHVPNARDVVCSGRTCTESDVANLCCTDRGKCTSFSCPSGFAVREHASNLYCRSAECAEDDMDLCCIRRATCATMLCPSNYTLKPQSQETYCSGPQCEVAVDVHHCCAERGKCTNFQCPEGYVQRQAAADIACTDAACSNTSFSVCCTREAHCTNYSCPSGYVQIEEPANVPCHGEVCTQRDQDRCCNKAAKCNSYTCPVGYVHQRGAADIACKGSVCTDMADLHKCCAEEFMCSSFNCPVGEVRRPNAHTIWCHDANCSTTQSHVCCAKQGKCDSFACSHGLVHKKDAHERYCSDVVCTETDMARCCEKAALCSDLVCPANFTTVDNAEEVNCKGPACTLDADADTCCVKEGFCRKYPCPVGFLHNRNPPDVVCNDPPCISDENTETCCHPQRTCASYVCPEKYVHVNGAASIFCRGMECNDADKNLCCKIYEPELCGARENNDGVLLPGMPIQASSGCDCEMHCQLQEQCTGWTYSQGRHTTPEGSNCWLRAFWGKGMSNCDGDCWSGMKQCPQYEYNIAHGESRYKEGPLSAQCGESCNCEQLCASQGECKAAGNMCKALHESASSQCFCRVVTATLYPPELATPVRTIPCLNASSASSSIAAAVAAWDASASPMGPVIHTLSTTRTTTASVRIESDATTSEEILPEVVTTTTTLERMTTSGMPLSSFSTTSTTTTTSVTTVAHAAAFHHAHSTTQAAGVTAAAGGTASATSTTAAGHTTSHNYYYYYYTQHDKSQTGTHGHHHGGHNASSNSFGRALCSLKPMATVLVLTMLRGLLQAPR